MNNPCIRLIGIANSSNKCIRIIGASCVLDIGTASVFQIYRNGQYNTLIGTPVYYIYMNSQCIKLKKNNQCIRLMWIAARVLD